MDRRVLAQAGLAALIVALTSACGSAGTSRPGGDGSATGAPLTEASSGQTVHLTVGQNVDVELPGGASGGYDQPSSSDDATVRRDSASGGYPASEPARARFTARRAGEADLSSMTDFTCLHSHPACLPPQKQWLVHVIVRPVAP